MSWWQWLWKICFPPLHVIARVVYACLGAHGRVYFMTRKVCSALLVVQDDIVHSHHQTLSSHKRCLLPFKYRLRVQESNYMPPHTMKWNYREANACDSISFSTPYWILEKNEIQTKHLNQYILLIGDKKSNDQISFKYSIV